MTEKLMKLSVVFDMDTGKIIELGIPGKMLVPKDPMEVTSEAFLTTISDFMALHRVRTKFDVVIEELEVIDKKPDEPVEKIVEIEPVAVKWTQKKLANEVLRIMSDGEWHVPNELTYKISCGAKRGSQYSEYIYKRIWSILKDLVEVGTLTEYVTRSKKEAMKLGVEKEFLFRKKTKCYQLTGVNSIED